jgi:hypothetical protein
MNLMNRVIINKNVILIEIFLISFSSNLKKMINMISNKKKINLINYIIIKLLIKIKLLKEGQTKTKSIFIIL